MEIGCLQNYSTSDDNVSEVVEQFSEVLKNLENKKLVNLYKLDNPKNWHKCKYKHTDVISSVVSTVKMIQNADKVDNCKDNTILKEYKKSVFWPVNAISDECKHHDDNLCTSVVQQCGPETQNMIETAQILTQMISHQGVSQEFNMSFYPESSKICDQSENLFDTKRITVESDVLNENNKGKDQLFCNSEDHKLLNVIQSSLAQVSTENDVSSFALSVKNNKTIHSQFVEPKNSDIISCQNEIETKKITENNTERGSCHTLLYSNDSKLMGDIEFCPTQILLKKEHEYNNIQTLPHSSGSKFIEDVQFLPTQLLPKKDNEYSECQTLPYSNVSKLLEDTELLSTQILPKKENSSDSKQIILTCDKMTESIDSNIIVNSNKSLQGIADTIPKSSVQNIKEVPVKSNTTEFKKEEIIEKSPVLYNDLNISHNSIVNNEGILLKQGFGVLNKNCDTEIKSDSPSLCISSDFVSLVSDLQFFGNFEKIASPIVHKYINCDKDKLKAKIVSKMEGNFLPVSENEQEMTMSSWDSVPVRQSYCGAVRPSFGSFVENVFLQSNTENFSPEENYHETNEIKEVNYFGYEIIGNDEESDYLNRDFYGSKSTIENLQTVDEVVFIENQRDDTNAMKVSSDNIQNAIGNAHKTVQRTKSLQDEVAGENGFFGSRQLHFLPVDISLDSFHNVDKMTEIGGSVGDKLNKFEHGKAERGLEMGEISFKNDNQFQNSDLKISDVKLIPCDKFLNEHIQDFDSHKEFDIFDDMFETDNSPATETINVVNYKKINNNIDKCTIPASSCFVNDQKFNENLMGLKISQANQKDSFDDDGLLKIDLEPAIAITNRIDNVIEEQNKNTSNNVNEVLNNMQGINNRLKINTFTLEKNGKTQSGCNSNDVNSLQANNYVDFTTASKKNIRISDKAMKRVMRLVEGWEDVNSNFHSDSENKTVDYNLKLPIEYSNAEDERVQIIDKEFKGSVYTLLPLTSEEAQKSRNVIHPNLSEIHVTPAYVGLPTASNERIQTTESSLYKSKHIFENLNIEQNDCKFLDMNERAVEESKLAENIDMSFDLSTPFIGFHTASNEKTEISKNALKITKKIFNCEFEPNDLAESISYVKNGERVVENNVERLEVSNKNSVFIGFQTASNKKVEISKEAIKKCKKMIKSWENEQGSLNNALDVNVLGRNEKEIIENGKPKSEIPMFIEFRTGSIKKTEISEEANQKTGKILESLEYENKNLDEQKNGYAANVGVEMTSTIPTFIGFQTASNKKVNVAQQALEESRKLIQDWDREQDISSIAKTEISRTRPVFTGFSTVRNKIDKVSEGAVARTKDMIKDLGYKENTDDDTERVTVKPIQSTYKLDSSTDTCKKSLTTINQVCLNNVSKRTSMVRSDLVNLIDTQVSKNFNETDCMEGFYKNISSYERSASPVLHSRNPKRRKISKIEDTKVHKNLNAELENLIDTQITNNFNETVYTEEFRNDASPFMRSISPVLQSSSAKRRKIFRTPFSKKVKRNEVVAKSEASKHIPEFIYKYKLDYKKIKKYTLGDLEVKNDNDHQSNIDLDLEDVMNSEFDVSRNSFTKRKMGMMQLKAIFMHSPGINDRIIPEGWFENHMKHITWKLISYEIKYSNMKNVFNVENVLDQLKYRYDRELYNCERPSLRKILEKDETSTRTIVLCVRKIFSNGTMASPPNSNMELELTDGWYTIKAIIDDLLKRMVSVGKIRIGTKIITQGAELVNCDQGVTPWEDTSNVRLKIYGNSTRRVRWNTRLGFHANSSILVPLSSVKIEGGKVSKIKVFVARVYPLLYMEKFEDGSTVTRSERLEHLYESKCEAERQMMLEKIYEEVEKEFDDKNSTDSEEIYVCGIGNVSKMETGSQIAKCMKRCKDPLEFQANLSEYQSDLLKRYTSKRQERKLKELHDKIQEKIDNSKLKNHRNVIAVLKSRIVDIRINDKHIETTKGLLSIWNVNENVMEMLKEGKWIEASNVLPTGTRAGEIKISANRHSIFSKSTIKDEQKFKPHVEELSRNCIPISQITRYPFKKFEFSEIDTVGLVFAIEPTTQEFRRQKNQYLQNVYFTDENRNFICVNFWSGLQKFGLDNLIDVGQIIICMNLQKRYGNINGCVPQFRATEFSCFTRIPKNIKSRIVYEELKKKLNSLNISIFCEECLHYKSVNLTRDNNENIFPYKSNNAEHVFAKSNFDKSKKQINNIMKLYFNGTDFESTFKNVNLDDLSPSERLRKKRLNEKLQKLRMYDEPPKLSPIHITNRSSKANSSYTSPLPENVAVRKDLLNDSCKNTNSKINVNAIVTPKNVNYKLNIHRSAVNPIKLDFSVDGSSRGHANVDLFSEEFDPSPPLSLDAQSF